MTAEFSSANARSSLWQPNRSRSKRVEAVVKALCFLFAAISILTTFGIVLTLIFETFEFLHDPFFRQALGVDQLPALLPDASQDYLEELGKQVMDSDPEDFTANTQDLGVTVPSQVESFFTPWGAFLRTPAGRPCFSRQILASSGRLALPCRPLPFILLLTNSLAIILRNRLQKQHNSPFCQSRRGVTPRKTKERWGTW